MLICIPTSTSKTQYFVNQAYADYVTESGYYPIMISQKNDPLRAAQFCDGLILPGGIDLDPTFYGEDNIHSLGVDPEKDDFERALLHAFIGAGKPIFGICRGFQLIVREYRKLQKPKSLMAQHSTYYQHINDHSLANSLDLFRNVFSHSIYADRNFLYNEDHKTYQRMFVNSMHHQALLATPRDRSANAKITRNLGGLIILGTATYGLEDSKSLNTHRVVEAITITDWGESRIVAVQWHPEELKDIALLQTFFNEQNGQAIEALSNVTTNTKKKMAKAAQVGESIEGHTDE